MLCPCGSKLELKNCCDLYIHGQQLPPTAEALMRSRYTAYTQANMDYIKKTMSGKPLLGFDVQAASEWAKSVTWVGLEVKNSFSENENLAYVEFVATLFEHQTLEKIHEISEFRKEHGIWVYVDGKNPSKNTTRKPSRNGPCPCGSKKKYKNCHGKESSS